MCVCGLGCGCVCVDVCVWLGVCTRVWHLYMICNVCTCVLYKMSKPSTCAFTDQFGYM